ncbi:MAG: hypothetical protein CSA07_03940 [Bacteroidia bacterium]|nr:MAG: hypothetical protein CSA07_03940 [Bacteroidia bacterium]
MALLAVAACMGTGCKKEKKKELFSIRVDQTAIRTRNGRFTIRLDLLAPGETVVGAGVPKEGEKGRWYTLRYNVSDLNGVLYPAGTCLVPRSPSHLVPAVSPYQYDTFVSNHSYEVSEGEITMSFATLKGYGRVTIFLRVEDGEGNVKEEKVEVVVEGWYGGGGRTESWGSSRTTHSSSGAAHTHEPI